MTVQDSGGTANGGDNSRTYTNQLTLTVNSVNDAPVLVDQVRAITLTEDVSDGSNTGSRISDLLASGSVTEASDNVTPGTASDNSAIEAIAITAKSTTGGTLQFSTNNGSNWANVGAVSNTSSLLLVSTDRVRFVPNQDFNGSAGSFTFRAWDQTTTGAGSAGTKVNTSTNGGTSEFSSETDTASITVTSVNDEPVLTVPNRTVNEDAGAQTVGGFTTTTS